MISARHAHVYNAYVCVAFNGLRVSALSRCTLLFMQYTRAHLTLQHRENIITPLIIRIRIIEFACVKSARICVMSVSFHQSN